MSNLSRSPTIALAAGGTGGHLFPALALGRELSRRGCETALLTDRRGMRLLRENQNLVDWRQERVREIPAATPYGRRGLGQSVRAAAILVAGVVASWRELRRIKADAAVGFGGYPSFAPLLAARLRGLPVCIHEQNAVLGRANRMLAPFARVVALAFPQTIHAEKIPGSVVTGLPVREDVLSAAAPYVPARVEENFRLLIFGGSQGARALSLILPKALASLPQETRARLRVIQQGRREDIADLERAYDALGIPRECAPFFADLPHRMSAAHLVIARAGASTVAELAALGRPSVLLPLPGSLDSDQEKNAAALTRGGGAWMLREGEGCVEELSDLLRRAVTCPQHLNEMAQAARRFGKPDAAALLADVVEGMRTRSARRDAAVSFCAGAAL